jgi:hypothetical protein
MPDINNLREEKLILVNGFRISIHCGREGMVEQSSSY